MARRKLVPERLWVGLGVLVFSLIVVYRGSVNNLTLMTIVGSVFAACGVLILLGVIKAPPGSYSRRFAN